MTSTPHSTEIRPLLEKAAKLMGKSIDPYMIGNRWYEFTAGPFGFNPATSAHDSAMLRIRLGISVTHLSDCVEADCYSMKINSVVILSNFTDDDKLKCELLAVLKCAGAILDEREKNGTN